MIVTIIKDIQSCNLDEKIKDQNVILLSTFVDDDSTINRGELEKTLISMGPDCLEKIYKSPAPKWAGFIHNDMALIAGQKMSLSTSERNILANNAAVPDSWGSWNHYKLTGATSEAEKYANIARAYYQQGDTTKGAYNLSYSLHFMTDMSMPFHYTPSGLLAHEDYEIYVSDHWTSGDDDEKYRDVVSGNNYYYIVTDVSDAADNLIDVTHWYQTYLEDQINNNPNWQDDSLLRDYTHDTILYGAKYNMGLIDYVK
ncbi:Zinc dependent phospholipase C [Methanoregula formicica SMSP]|uniref:Zinc dependent phospholipase C n=2 Tax=Methanoregula formicica TaxID=882104 RepID=L0HE51_METFS|nr:Zinc dependent phospholipase C [Methanoregula formicica SMSP]